MQILIDIPEEVYKLAKKTNILEADVNALANTIRNGIALPEKHGPIVDLCDIEVTNLGEKVKLEAKPIIEATEETK